MLLDRTITISVAEHKYYFIGMVTWLQAVSVTYNLTRLPSKAKVQMTSG